MKNGCLRCRPTALPYRGAAYERHPQCSIFADNYTNSGHRSFKDGALSLIDKSYTRSDKLNITSITDAVAAGNSQSLWYNKSNRLQNANGPWGNKTFTYDGTGNRTTEITGSVTDTLGYPGGSNRIADVVTGTTTTRTFTHDGAGNITTDVRSGSTYTFGYNARGRLATVHQDGNLKGTYQYNSLEQLASRVVTNSGPFNGTIH
ncbi:MAG: hypothetical protein ABL908_04825, partial [Hyphomicrobium sp.]